MERATLLRLRPILVDALCVSPDAVTPEAALDDLGADSLDKAAIAVRAETEFGLSDYAITDDDIEGLVTVADLVSLIERRSA